MKLEKGYDKKQYTAETPKLTTIVKTPKLGVFTTICLNVIIFSIIYCYSSTVVEASPLLLNSTSLINSAR